MEKEFSFDVSVLVIAYKPDLQKLLMTLRSVLLQSGIRKQIIVADDGSEQNYFPEIEALFHEHQFSDYVLVGNPENLGITKNFYSGLVKAEGEFLKGISPGDFLYAADTLAKWHRYMKEHQYDGSFGDAVYFRPGPDGPQPIEKNLSHPYLRHLFDGAGYREKLVKENVWVNKDYILGASYFVRTALVRKYCEPLVGKVKYMEDVLYRMMLLDGIRTVHYPVNVVMYEFGMGVSTTKESKWTKIMADEERIVESMIIQNGRKDRFFENLRAYYRMDRSNRMRRRLFVLFRFPGAWFCRIRRRILEKLGKCYTDTAFDQAFMNKIRG